MMTLSKQRQRHLTYLAGIAILGLMSHWMRRSFSGPLYLVIGIAYLVVLRVIADRVGKER